MKRSQKSESNSGVKKKRPKTASMSVGDTSTAPSQADSSKMEPKVFNDPIHGQMEFHPVLVKIIDTPQFQRLRYLRQLGGAYFVYPGAAHNRFEHSLGVAHLAGQFMRRLQKNQSELGITERDILCVQIAGLCHDLGHGPFSHMFDDMFLPNAQGSSQTGWKHEKGSIDMFKHIVEYLNQKHKFDLKSELEKLSPKDDGDDLAFIREMINGPDEKGHYSGRPSNKSFLYEIIANKRNGLDVDKFDYLARDYHHLGIKNNFDHNRYITFARVLKVDGQHQICIRDKELPNIYEIFHMRCSLHRKACQHKTNQVIQLMVRDALLKADEVLNISKMINNMSDYTELTDGIFEKILHSTEDNLKESREILQNIVSRKLYTYLGKTKLPDGLAINDKKIEEWKKNLAKIPTDREESSVKENDFEIYITTFDFGQKEKNPMDALYVYYKSDNNKAVKIPSEQVSQFLLPKRFSEKWISVFCTSPDENTQRVAKNNFDEWCRRNKFSPSPPRLLKDNPQPKVFNDPIHGLMEFGQILVKIIDTPQFQRLRFIKQLGGAYFVYPGASHNRFEHSLGVAHLAGLFLKALQKEQPDIADKDILCVQIAGLCHDLGHGPFSDVWDRIFLQKKYPGVDWKLQRRKMSVELFKQIEETVRLTNLLDEDKIFIEEIITGIKKETAPGRPKEKHFLYDIIRNKGNGVGVKLFDSVARDCYHLGLKTNFDHHRFIKHAKVLQVENTNQLCIRDKVMSAMYDLSHTIAALQTKVYQHNVTITIELMMADVIHAAATAAAAAPATTAAIVPQIYSQLTDSLFGERLADLEMAKDIVQRIHSRDLYTYVTKVQKREGTTLDQEKIIKRLATDLPTDPNNIVIHEKSFGNQDLISGMNFFDKGRQIVPPNKIEKKKQEMYELQIKSRQWIYVFLKMLEHAQKIETLATIVEKTLMELEYTATT